jgi:hypothetical protein
MSVVDAFFQWYGTLHPNDKQTLCSFLVEWLNQSSPQQKVGDPRFSGRTAPPVTSKTIGKSRTVQCQNCGSLIAIDG